MADKSRRGKQRTVRLTEAAGALPPRKTSKKDSSWRSAGALPKKGTKKGGTKKK